GTQTPAKPVTALALPPRALSVISPRLSRLCPASPPHPQIPTQILPETSRSRPVYRRLGTPMGIPNLLRFMKPFIEPVHIKKYAGQRVGIDAYSWLHKGAYSCSMELCMSPRSAGARRYISYFMHHVNLLRHHKVVPVVVFDGGSMPCKSATDEDRHKKRELSLVLGKEKLKQGNTAAAIDLFRV
uniref:Exonuclease 1 n=1 Tax=Aegilops tauschii subsp. strangulata TaxID=200361 RepID=A0A453S9B4_AEGTS